MTTKMPMTSGKKMKEIENFMLTEACQYLSRWEIDIMTHTRRLALSIEYLLHTATGICFSWSILVPVSSRLEVEAYFELVRCVQ